MKGLDVLAISDIKRDTCIDWLVCALDRDGLWECHAFINRLRETRLSKFQKGKNPNSTGYGLKTKVVTQISMVDGTKVASLAESCMTITVVAKTPTPLAYYPVPTIAQQNTNN